MSYNASEPVSGILRNIFAPANSVFLPSQDGEEAGLRYASEGDNIFKSARKYAKEEISKMEKKYAKDCDTSKRKNKKLDMFELMNAYNQNDNYYLEEKYWNGLCDMNIDKDPLSIGEKELASYAIAIDALQYNKEYGSFTFDIKNANGNITKEEAELAQSLDPETLRKYAKSVYDML